MSKELRATTEEMAASLSPARDARVTSCCGGLARVVMDDDGFGEFERVVTNDEADELVRRGVVRDAR